VVVRDSNIVCFAIGPSKNHPPLVGAGSVSTTSNSIGSNGFLRVAT
jgi:hypothetical protein